MKILVFSSTPWSHDNSFGNSFSNIFEGIEDVEIANIACRPGMPTSYLVKRYFQITEKSLINNLKNKNFSSGKELKINVGECESAYTENISGVKFGKKKRWQILFWARDLIWKLGRWKSKELIDFIDDFKPDLIFQPVYFSSYLNDIVYFIKNHTDAPMLGYISDDCYTLKQFSISPLYWIDRLSKRRKVKRTIEQCELLYVISNIQKEEYEKIFTPPCKILTKCADFSEPAQLKSEYNDPLQLVFTGNIGTNRWKSLKLIADALEEINKGGVKAQLRVYTATPLTKRMEKALNRGETSFIMGSVPASEIADIQNNADILVHVEAYDLKNRWAVRQSFSTKIVDYLKAARPILAVGPLDVASIDHLVRNNCAIVAQNEEEIIQKLESIIENPSILTETAIKGYECGILYHNKEKIQKMLQDDFERLVSK